MRLRAYKDLIDEAIKLPNKIISKSYLEFNHDPKATAVFAIMKKARLDVGALFDCEFVELHEYIRDKL